MGDTTREQKNNTYFVDLKTHLGTYNKWCNRVQKVNCVGDLELLSVGHKIAIMGGRKLSNYGERVVDRIVLETCVSGRLTIISGDLSGVERRTMTLLKNKKAKAILVTVKGVDKAASNYGWILDNGGLIISVAGLALPRFLEVEAHKLMASLAKKVIFFEVGKNSNSFKTALEYFDRDIDVMLVPYPVETLYGDGGNKLLARNIGRLVCGVEDVLLRDVEPYFDIENNSKVIVGYRKNDLLYKAISLGNETVESIMQTTGIPMGDLFVRLQELLSEKIITEKNGRYFVS
jgi:predicted Rossmann fold nucleotide-binding protein DprA/Smf involved in DNA uptake